MATPFLLGEVEISKLTRLKQKAELHPVDMTNLLERLKDPAVKKRHKKQMTAQTVYLPFGYMVTFSMELNHPGGQKARHMSMSSPAEGRVPNQFSVWMVAEHLGFTGPHSDITMAKENLKMCDAVWLEDLEGHEKAVNVVQFVMASTTKQ